MQGAQYELTNIFLLFEIYNVNYKGEVGTVYLCFRAKSNSDFFCLSQLSLLQSVLSLCLSSLLTAEFHQSLVGKISCGVSSLGIHTIW